MVIHVHFFARMLLWPQRQEECDKNWFGHVGNVLILLASRPPMYNMILKVENCQTTNFDDFHRIYASFTVLACIRTVLVLGFPRNSPCRCSDRSTIPPHKCGETLALDKLRGCWNKGGGLAREGWNGRHAFAICSCRITDRKDKLQQKTNKGAATPSDFASYRSSDMNRHLASLWLRLFSEVILVSF